MAASQSHTNFMEIKIHTAKCDTCNKHNTSTMYRCQDCGQQCCTPCWMRKGGDGTHILNAGDKGWTGEKAQITAVPRGKRAPRKPSESKVTKSQRQQRNRRVVVVDEEDQDEEMWEVLDDEIEEGEVIGTLPKRATRRMRNTNLSDNGLALTAPKTPERETDLKTALPTFTQRDPSIQAAGDRLLLNAMGIEPTGEDSQNLSMLLRAVAEVESPQSRLRGLPMEEPGAGFQHDGLPDSPLFVQGEDVEMDQAEVTGWAQSQALGQDPRTDRKGSFLQILAERNRSAHARKVERSTFQE